MSEKHAVYDYTEQARIAADVMRKMDEIGAEVICRSDTRDDAKREYFERLYGAEATRPAPQHTGKGRFTVSHSPETLEGTRWDDIAQDFIDNQ